MCVCAPPCLGGGDFVSVLLCISVFVRTCVCFFTLMFVFEYGVERVSVRGSLCAFVCVSVCVSAFLWLCFSELCSVGCAVRYVPVWWQWFCV